MKIILCILLGSAIGILSCRQMTQEEHPNILIIYADDLGYGDISSYNQDSKIPTTHIDALASSGLSFTDAHSAAAVCTPSRYALLTGEYPFRKGMDKGVLWTYAHPLLSVGQQTIAKELKDQGYHTAIIGKWHLGFDWPKTKHIPSADWDKMNEVEKEVYLDFTQPIKGGPNSFGFDYFFGMDTPNFPPYAFIKNEFIEGPVPIREDIFSIESAVPGVQQKGWSNANILPRLRKEALLYLEKQANSKDPFFLFLSLTAPHTPISPISEFRGKSSAGKYGDLVVQIDDLVGSLLQKLDELSIRDNTIVIFTSDNGSPSQFDGSSQFGSIHKEYNHFPNGQLKGLKGDSWEGGHRVPFIVSWPGNIKEDTRSSRMICQTDMFATFLDVLNSKSLDNHPRDSYSLKSLWQGKSNFERRQLVTQSSLGHISIREGNWKLILGKGSGGLTSRIDPNDGISAWEGQLFDLDKDLKEQNNLYGELKYRSKIEALESKLFEIRSKAYHLN